MTLPTKLIADYSELASQYLDSIPVEKEEDFGKIREALLSITKPDENHEVSPSLKDRVKKIEEILDPEMMYVKDPAHYGQFKAIILQRVAAKIQEIENLKPEEKIKYIENQKNPPELGSRQLVHDNPSPVHDNPSPAAGSELGVYAEAFVIQEQLRQNFRQSMYPQRAQLRESIDRIVQESFQQRTEIFNNILQAHIPNNDLDAEHRILNIVGRMLRRIFD